MYHERAAWLPVIRAWANACGCGTDNAASDRRGRHPVPAAAVLRKPVQEDGDACRAAPAGRGGVGDLKAERRVGKALHAAIFA
jgi:hypothetical protein